MFILDCSVTMAWCFEDQTTPYTEKVLTALKSTKAIVPELWCQEVTNCLLVAERKKKISFSDSKQFIGLLNQLPIQIFDSKNTKMNEVLLNLGRSSHLSAYDAVYLKLAIDLGAPLATQDAALIKACKDNLLNIFR